MRLGRRILPYLAAAVMLSCAWCIEAQTPSESLAQIIRELPAHAGDQSPDWRLAIAERMGSDPLPAVKEALPDLVGLTESADESTRQSALLGLMGLSGRTKLGLQNRPQVDTTAVALLVPYITRLAPLMNDPAQPTREVCLLVLGGISVVRPAPRALLDILLAALRDPHSTTPLGGAPPGKNIAAQQSMGPQILWILLRVGATFSLNPVTHITEGGDSEEVQAAVIQFLDRPDQTPESLSESVRAIELAQPQNPAVNEQLVNLLDSPSERIRVAMLTNLPKVRLSPQLYEAARQRVMQMESDPAASPLVRSSAKQLLACWGDNRHPCMVP